jgi:hypothetical protein
MTASSLIPPSPRSGITDDHDHRPTASPVLHDGRFSRRSSRRRPEALRAAAWKAARRMNS